MFSYAAASRVSTPPPWPASNTLVYMDARAWFLYGLYYKVHVYKDKMEINYLADGSLHKIYKSLRHKLTNMYT